MAYRHPEKRKEYSMDRLTVMGAVLFVVAAGVIARLFMLQVMHHGWYVALAEGRDAFANSFTPVRGQIYFRDATNKDSLLPVATNREMRLLYAVPKEVKDPEGTALKLAELLPVDKDVLLSKLQSRGQYVPLAHELTKDLAQKVLRKKLPGIRDEQELTRYYPFADTTSHLTGFVGYKGDKRVGQYGIEGYLDSQLAGTLGHIDGDGTDVGFISQAHNGDSVVLTIDRTVQFEACTKLQEAVSKHGADGGTVIIVDPKTGAIIAMCNVPIFDANAYRTTPDISVFTNEAISGTYEPGSVIKTLTMASGIDAGVITPDTTYTDTGSVQIGKYTIKNSESKKYGVQTMSGVLEQSINTGAIFVSRLLGQDRFRKYFEKFGLGELSGIELQGENKGNIAPLKQKGDIYSATASFGQGISMTPLQLTMAYAAVANGGKLMKPYVVDETIKASGYHQKTEPKVVRQVVKAQAAQTTMAMLVNVVRKGHGKRAGIPGYFIGGKTGTAQVPLTDRAGYDPNKHNGTFVGYATMSDPRFVMLVKINDPKDVQFAESSAAPLFGQLAQFLIDYYQIQPDDPATLPTK